jgi:hypothetical protein
MPLPADQAIVETSDTLVKTLRGAFGTPESYRPGSFDFLASHINRCNPSCLHCIGEAF